MGQFCVQVGVGSGLFFFSGGGWSLFGPFGEKEKIPNFMVAKGFFSLLYKNVCLTHSQLQSSSLLRMTDGGI